MRKPTFSTVLKWPKVKRTLQIMMVFVGALVLQARAHAMTSAIERVFPKCFDSQGLTVEFFSFKDTRYGIAFATTDKGVPIIFYNREKLENELTSLDSAKFVFHHECGHHVLNHLRAEAQKRGSKVLELEADCYAAKQARKAGLGVNKIIKDISLFHGRASHPSGAARAKALKECYLNPAL